jgi:type I restriction enzyme S subunit
VNREATYGADLEVPDGWSLLPLADLCASVQAGPPVTGDERTASDDGVRLVLPRDLADQRIVPADPVGVVSDKARNLAKYLLREGDILVTRTGTVGRCALVTGAESGWLYHANLVRLRLCPGALDDAGPSTAAYVTGYLSAHTAQDWIRSRATRAVIPSVSTRVLGELPVLLPPAAEREAIGATLAALDDKIRAHARIARTTAEYRSVLADALTAGVLPARE